MDKTTPHHIGFIVDGNRRWAKERGLPTLEGHRRGFDALMEVIEECFKQGVEVVSAYIFSTENWDRSKEEVEYLMKLFETMFDKQIKTLHEKGVKVCFLGSRTYNVSPKLVKLIEKAEDLTKNNTKKTLALCFNYGGQLEIADAVKSLLGGGLCSGRHHARVNRRAPLPPGNPAGRFHGSHQRRTAHQ
jgi:undecaprenyl diphosphate synthase